MRRPLFFLFAMFGLTLLAACDDRSDDGPVVVSIIGKPREITEPLTHHRTVAGRTMLAATAQGLVSYDVDDEVVPALAQRWIVADEGKSYIFRLRRAQWANGAGTDGKQIDAREVARLLLARIKSAKTLDPFGNMSAVTDVLAMTTDVIEIRLASARPNFLLMLAQPQMAIARKTGGTGPYSKAVQEDAVLLTPRGDADEAKAPSAQRLIRAERAAKAVARFVSGEADLVLGGTIADLPIAQAARFPRQALRIDPALGLFGLAVMRHTPLTDDAEVRAAIAMSIDRAALVAQFENDWSAMETFSPPLTNLPHPPTRPEWTSITLRDRKVEASKIVARWQRDNMDRPAVVTLATGREPGQRLLFSIIAHDLAQIGILARAEERADKADLVLIDELASYDSAFWYLGRLSCARDLHCDPQGDELLSQASAAQDLSERNRLLGEAEIVIARHGGFIPLAAPLRWSLVRSRLQGFRPSRLALHPLGSLNSN